MIFKVLGTPYHSIQFLLAENDITFTRDVRNEEREYFQLSRSGEDGMAFLCRIYLCLLAYLKRQVSEVSIIQKIQLTAVNVIVCSEEMQSRHSSSLFLSRIKL